MDLQSSPFVAIVVKFLVFAHTEIITAQNPGDKSISGVASQGSNPTGVYLATPNFAGSDQCFLSPYHFHILATVNLIVKYLCVKYKKTSPIYLRNC